jgi:hypothetical protein
LTTSEENLKSAANASFFYTFITESLFSFYDSLSWPDLSYCSIFVSGPLIQTRSWLHSLVREEKYAARISMEWLSEWFELVATAVCNLHD